MNKYEVTKMSLVKDESSKTKGYATVLINDCFSVHGVRVVENNKGNLFIGTPSYADNKGDFHDIVFPVTKEDREAFDKAVIDSYNEKTKQREESAEKTTDFNVRVYLNKNEDQPNILGAASVTIGGGFAVNGVRIMRNSETGELFLSNPTYMRNDGTYREVCNPITKGAYEKLKTMVLEEFEHAVAEQKEALQSNKPRLNIDEVPKSVDMAMER